MEDNLNRPAAEKTEIIAHRGFSAIAPENTLAAFSAAIQHQADSIEFDVQLSKSGVPVIIHDATVNRTTNGRGKVRNKTLDQLKALDAGSWFSPQFKGEPIPTLAEALNALKDIRAFIYPEVKSSRYWSESDIDKFVRSLIETGWEDRCIVACFNHNFLKQIRQVSSRIILGYSVRSAWGYRKVLPWAIADGNAVIISKYSVLLRNPSLVQASRNQGVDVVVWTVDSEKDLHKLANIGVVRVITNSLIKT